MLMAERSNTAVPCCIPKLDLLVQAERVVLVLVLVLVSTRPHQGWP